MQMMVGEWGFYGGFMVIVATKAAWHGHKSQNECLDDLHMFLDWQILFAARVTAVTWFKDDDG